MDYREIRVVLAGPVAELVLSRPDSRNAMSSRMGDEIEHAVESLNTQSDVRAVLLYGDGQTFSAGGDFKMLEERVHATEAQNRVTMRRFYDSFLSVRRLRAPTIAMLHGAAIGAGLCLGMACDIRLAARKTKLAANFIRVGIHPGMGATWLLPRLVGPAKAAELLLTGRTLEAEDALSIGLINQVCEADQLEIRARELAAQIARGAPVAVVQTKETLHNQSRAELESALDREAAAQAVDFATADFREALRAFGEKRAPRFEGA